MNSSPAGSSRCKDVAEMGGERLVGHVVERQPRPVEVDVTRLQDESLVIE